MQTTNICATNRTLHTSEREDTDNANPKMEQEDKHPKTHC
jgi:hypothetical protein